MKKVVLLLACMIAIFSPVATLAANVTKIVITTTEPQVGNKPSYKASVPATASTEVADVRWSGDFDNGLFVQGRSYTMTVKVRIKPGSPNRFGTQNINVTINGHKAKVTYLCKDDITVKYTWKTLGGVNPDDPKYQLKTKLKQIAAEYPVTNASNDKEILKHLRECLPGAEIWSTGGSYSFTRKMPSETEDGNINVPIGIRYQGVTFENYNFRIVLPALSKSPEAAKLSADMELMKAALQNLIVTSKTTGDDILAAANAAAVNGSIAVWDKNYKYSPPTPNHQGSIDGNLIIALADKKDIFHTHKTLPIDGTEADVAVDADFSALSKALHRVEVSNKTTKEELMGIANAAINNGSSLTCTDFIKTDATFDEKGKIVMYFELKNQDKVRHPRIAMIIGQVQAVIPPGLAASQFEWQLCRITNQVRFRLGLTLLPVATPLQKAAEIRAREIYRDYRPDHTRPDGTLFATAIEPSFLEDKTTGENMQCNGKTPKEVIRAWLHSPGHKENMLKESHCYMGAGMHRNTNDTYCIQLFAGSCQVKGVESSTGSFHFKTVEEMENAYVICEMDYKTKAYIPFDVSYMMQDGNKYTMKLKGITVTVTVEEI